MTRLSKQCLLLAPFAASLAPSLLLAGCQSPIALVHQAMAILDRPSAHMPQPAQVAVQFEPQKWSADQREWFYHASQGTELVPYSWYCALEQPKITIFNSAPRFADTAYLAGFGFLPPTSEPASCPLPVGFARDTVTDVHTGQSLDVVGLTCAACHTGQLNYQGKGIRIDGGSATVDLASFQTELGYAAAFTDMLPFRFDRFARQVIGSNATPEARAQLRQQFKDFLAAGKAENDAAVSRNLYHAAGGFGRTDALGRIGNFVFGTELSNANLVVADAPVKFPPIWYTSWFAWVQYNASIQQPMVRNIGEALGVRARVNLTDKDKLYRSTVNVKNLWKMEDQIGGPALFAGMQTPPWPEDVFGPIDHAKAQNGAALYQQHCQKCHLPPLDSPDLQDDKNWEAGLDGKRFLKLKVIGLQSIGTDPREATDWAARTAETGPLGLGTVKATDALRLVTSRIRDQSYADLGLTPAQIMEWNGYRDDNVTAPLGYRARPLAGLWSSPPFLHNGSVPSLYQLLLPAGQRAKTFYTGSREFDPKSVGYRVEAFKDGFPYDTSQIGNSNAGHSFENTPGPGVIGSELSDDERWALIEYLKSLKGPALSTP